MTTDPVEPVKQTEKISPDELRAIRPDEPHRGMALLIYHRDGVKFVPLRDDRPLVVGREPPPGAGSLAVRDLSLSRAHARFSSTGDTVEVVDLTSSNGTWLRGERLSRAVLAPGNEIRLGAVSVLIHGGVKLPAPPRLLSHERFRIALEQEVVRQRYFHRSFALAMVRVEAWPAPHVGDFLPYVLERLRPVDQMAFYSPDTLELLLPEAGIEEAKRLVDALLSSFQDRAPLLLAGIAVYPDSAVDAEALIGECRTALLSTGANDRVRAAPLGTRTSNRSASPGGEDEIIAESAALRRLFDKACALARSNLPVLILGETGVGKEMLAQRIHAESPRRGKDLFVVNCAAIPETLMEATLFGHQRGAFTGATQQNKGYFEAADGSTLLLDEVGDLPKPSQAALLRVLEARRVRRVGATEEIPLDVRIIAATHRDLKAMVQRGEFREDLWHRLNGATLSMPALRERVEEIEPLCQHFLRKANEDNGRAVSSIGPRAMDLLMAYSWPGNVRELRNAIEHAVVLTLSDVITPEDLPERVRTLVSSSNEPAPGSSGGGDEEAEGDDFRTRVENYERRLIVKALNACGANQKAAAERLNLPLRTMNYKMRALDIRRAPYTEPKRRDRRRG